MAMSKRDFEAIAKVFRGRCNSPYVSNEAIATLVSDFCNTATTVNPRFDVETFIAAAITPEMDHLIERVKSMFGGTTCYPARCIWQKGASV